MLFISQAIKRFGCEKVRSTRSKERARYGQEDQMSVVATLGRVTSHKYMSCSLKKIMFTHTHVDASWKYPSLEEFPNLSSQNGTSAISPPQPTAALLGSNALQTCSLMRQAGELARRRPPSPRMDKLIKSCYKQRGAGFSLRLDAAPSQRAPQSRSAGPCQPC